MGVVGNLNPITYIVMSIVDLYQRMKFFSRSLRILFVLCIPLLMQAQSFENVESSFDGENVIITYDLVSDDPTSRYSVTFYSSHDRYAIPLKSVKGDVGDGVLPGRGHVIVWDARNNLPADFSSEVTVKLKGAPTAAALTTEPLARSVYKKGEQVDINWKGGLLTDKIVISLTRKNSIKKQLAVSLDNNHSYSWKIPDNISAGKNYGVTVTKAGETDDLSKMQPFRIKARIPIWLKVLPVVAAGVVVGIIAGGGSDGGGGKEVLGDLPPPKNGPI